MQDLEEFVIELSIGETLQIGNSSVTVIDIDGGHVFFRLEDEEVLGEELMLAGGQRSFPPH